ncbi:hypothetical protein SCP_1503210 [Sparassis crispa]|uniref:Fungal-type protein kinase domain-containing protein n=1 Tax=Sparassis crispa TaxID=139825 RepID=A0A401H4I2_9APHY|nr:hypothetical protein SCP_1503210 [Sparassis crispa]GBE89313.1 hypothetical protein SCP_1503210 [Sparassis crispa]
MHAKFVLMPVDEFMDDFVPNFQNPLDQQKPDFIDAFENMPGNNKREFDLYKPFVDCVEDAKLCPGHTLRLAQNKADPDDPSRQKVDAALFRTSDNVPEDDRPHWALQHLSIEFKRHRTWDDPFEDKKRKPKRAHKTTKVDDDVGISPKPEQLSHEDPSYMPKSGSLLPGDSLADVMGKGPHDMSRFARLNDVWVLKNSRKYDHFYPSITKMVDTDEDLFQTPPISLRAEDNAKAIFMTAAEADAQRRTAVRGQIISYAKMIFSRQHRCFVFTVLILGDCARIIRWDHAGAIVTHKFHYMTTEHLSEFLWRFSYMTVMQQGYDTSAVPVVSGSADYKLMQKMAVPVDPSDRSKNDYARQSFVKSLNLKDFKEDGPDEWLCWKFTIIPEKRRQKGDVSADRPANPEASSGECREMHFPQGEPKASCATLPVDCEREKFVFLKDAWRVDLDDIEMEGHILATLNREKVENVPTLECHGDVEGRFQQTVTHSYLKLGHPDDLNPIKKHSHYRLVVEEICRPLKDFKNTRELVKIIANCIHAHRLATIRARLTHRDVSAGNLLINETVVKTDGEYETVRTGLLCDWELSKPIEDEDDENQEDIDSEEDLSRESDANNLEIQNVTFKQKKPRQPDRTGTWQFLSALLLDYPWKSVTIPDELEAFFNVLLFHVVRYTNSTVRNVPVFMSQYFDEGTIDSLDVQYTCGSAKRNAIETGTLKEKMKKPITFLDNNGSDHLPLNTIIKELLQLFQAHYSVTLPALLQAQTADQSVHRQKDSDQQLLDRAQTSSEAAADGNTKKRSIQNMLDAQLEAKWQAECTTYTHKSSGELKTPETRLTRKNRAAAEKLKTQDYVYDFLLRMYFQKKWPEHDKIGDRIPPHYSYADYRERGLRFPPPASSSSGSESPSEALRRSRPSKRPRLPVPAPSSTSRGRPPSSYARRKGKQPARPNAIARRF